MSRLTIDKLYSEIVVLMTHCATTNMEYLSSTECANRFKSILETIKEYKDIEEELGIPLTTFFRILKADRIYAKDIGYLYTDLYFFDGDIAKWSFDAEGNDCYKKFFIKDFGKDWAFTKEELQ